MSKLMQDIISFINQKLQTINSIGWTRQCKTIDKNILNFSSNDYLGLAHDKRILNAIYEAGKQYGHGSTGSRFITGTSPLHLQFEQEFAEYKCQEAGLLFNTGYQANQAVISTLFNAQDIIFTDKYNHASILSGIELSKATAKTYKHLDLNHLEELLIKYRGQYNKACIVTDRIFSMDGDGLDSVAINSLYALAEKFQCLLIIDEAHYIQNPAESNININKPNILTVSTCSKAMGLEGAVITGRQEIINYLKQRASGFIYTTAISPAIVGGLLESLSIIKSETMNINTLYANIKYFQETIPKYFQNNPSFNNLLTPIFTVLLPDSHSAVNISEELLNNHQIYIQAIRPPTVPTARLRITLSNTHYIADIKYLTDILTDLIQI